MNHGKTQCVSLAAQAKTKSIMHNFEIHRRALSERAWPRIRKNTVS